jgi:multiple sugar transport system permease protein
LTKKKGNCRMNQARRILPHFLLAIFSLYILLPPLWVLRTSFVSDASAYKPALLPDVTLANFIKLFAKDAFALAYRDSFVAAAGSTLLGLPIAAMTGYAFARYRTGGQASRFLILATQMLPPVALVLPTFGLFRVMGLTNSVTGLVIAYGAINLPFLTWIMMGFFEGVPIELEWAAMTDGATVWSAFWRIVLPISLPGLAAAGVLGFILAWNEFLFALILTGPTTATIPVALAGLQSQNGVEIAEISAGVVLAVAPLLIASRFIQNNLVRGLTLGAIK